MDTTRTPPLDQPAVLPLRQDTDESKEEGRQAPALLKRRFTCRRTLQAASIQYLRHGGLYLPCDFHYPLGSPLCVLLRVASGENELCLPGTVVLTGPLPGPWRGSSGVGLAFSDADSQTALMTLLETDNNILLANEGNASPVDSTRLYE